MYKKLKYIEFYIKIFCNFRMKKKQLIANKVDIDLWEKKFVNLLKSGDSRFEELLTEFLSCRIRKISHHKVKRKNKYSPILFCVIRNDIYKIKGFMEHYRQLGVEIFVFLDNDSDDGTKEYLCQQSDVILYHSEQQYTSARRVAWLNRLLAIYGCNKWCLIVDSDELVTYIDYEKHKISDIVKIAEENHCYRIEGFMLDMYADNEIFQNNSSDDYIRNFRYFDALTYRLDVIKNRVKITGGPRTRIFRTEPTLSKYPLFYYRKEDIVASSHYMVPVESIRKCPIWIALCHYKFVDTCDLYKMKEAVYNENYAGGSFLYKKYLSKFEENQEINFYEQGISYEMKNSGCLKNISFLKSPFMDNGN